MTNTSDSRKRKADVLGRIDGTTTSSGAVNGWTTCPLCGRHSQKKFAMGRGIATHLHAAHTPWNPGKVERKRREREHKRKQAERKRKGVVHSDEQENDSIGPTSWTPTEEQRQAWDEQVLQILKEIEDKAGEAPCRQDKNGNAIEEYRDSLPPFIQAAADGHLNVIEEMIVRAEAKSDENVVELLNTRDRHMSLAEHWAAGGGHLECLKLLRAKRKRYGGMNEPEKKMRRRDGKSCLHYAARNGKLDCLRYLIEEEKMVVDDRSGDGTTPFHLALFGCHLHAAKYLIERGASVLRTNDWKCGPAHWLALTKEPSDTLDALCGLLEKHGVSFTEVQSQGHTPLHKAAQKLNREFLKWVISKSKLDRNELIEASGPDNGGHTPVDIWLSFGGDTDFADWMKSETFSLKRVGE